MYSWLLDCNFLLLRPYHSEHGPKEPVTPLKVHVVLQRVLQKVECMSILTKSSKKLRSHNALECRVAAAELAWHA